MEEAGNLLGALAVGPSRGDVALPAREAVERLWLAVDLLDRWPEMLPPSPDPPAPKSSRRHDPAVQEREYATAVASTALLALLEGPDAIGATYRKACRVGSKLAALSVEGLTLDCVSTSRLLGSVGLRCHTAGGLGWAVTVLRHGLAVGKELQVEAADALSLYTTLAEALDFLGKHRQAAKVAAAGLKRFPMGALAPCLAVRPPAAMQVRLLSVRSDIVCVLYHRRITNWGSVKCRARAVADSYRRTGICW